MGGGDGLDVVNRFNDAWGAHDLDACLAMLTDDCLFASTGPAPDGEDLRGKEAIRAAWKPIFDDAASVFTTGHVRGVDLFRVRDGLVAEKLSYVKG